MISLYGLRRWMVEAKREPNWNTASRQCKQNTPHCVICNAKTNLEAHDVKPYHLIPPDVRKKMTVAQWLKNMRTVNHDCHFGIGHCEDPNYLQYNPHLDDIIAYINYEARACRTTKLH